MGKQILYIEPNFHYRTALTNYFSSLGYSIDGVESAKEALEWLQKRLSNLILMGNEIPDIDGFDLCIQLRSTNRTKHIPIIFLTQRDKRSEKLAGYELGMNDFLTESPLNVAELKLHIGNAIGSARPIMSPNPLSGFPNADVIEEHMRYLLRIRNLDWTYTDIRIHNIDIFTEIYGWQASEEVIQNTAKIVGDNLKKYGTNDDLVGHIWNKDFVLISQTEHIQTLIDAILKQFEQDMPNFHSEEEMKRGCTIFNDREYPLISLEYGICDVSKLKHENLDLRTIAELGSDDRRRRFDKRADDPPILTAW